MASIKRQISDSEKLEVLTKQRRNDTLFCFVDDHWRNKDDGAWSIPKGEIGTSEDPEQTARREFTEELGPAASIGHLQALGAIRQRGGKRVIAFCGETDFDTSSLSSDTFEIEWPPKSGRLQPFPEIDRAEWFDLEAARSKILSGQIELIDRLEKEVT